VGNESGRAAARAALEAALSGIELTEPQRRFVARISQWDKRNAFAVTALIARARQHGHDEGRLEYVALAEALCDLDRAVEVLEEPVAG
jgi:hypothetical protein